MTTGQINQEADMLIQQVKNYRQKLNQTNGFLLVFKNNQFTILMNKLNTGKGEKKTAIALFCFVLIYSNDLYH